MDADYNTTTYGYDAAGNETSVTDPDLHTSYSYYDAAGNLTETVDGASEATTYGYDDAGNQTSVTDPAGHTSTTSFDAAGNVTKTVDADGHTTSFGYDGDNRQTSVTDGDLHTSYTYLDGDGNVTESVDGGGHATTYGYDGDGNQTSLTDANGHTSTTSFDNAGNVTKSVDGAGDTTSFLYDAAGNQTEVIDPDLHTTSNAYDAAGNVTQTIDGSGRTSSFGYDGDNRRTSVTDGNSNSSYTYFDGAGNVTEQTDGAGNATSFLFDAAGNRTAVIDPDSNTTSYAFDAANRQTSMTDPLSNSSSWQYDDAGRLTETIDGDNRTISSSYDDAGYETAQVWYASDGSTVTNSLSFAYDDAGNETYAADDAGAYTLSYDAANRVTHVNEPFGQTLTMSYDAVGNRTLVEDSQGGTTSSSYDDANRLTSRVQTAGGTTPMKVSASYDAAGNVTLQSDYEGDGMGGWTLAAQTSYSYDGANRVTEIASENGSATAMADYSYAYDPAGQLTWESDSSQGGTAVTTTYNYDAAGQMTGAGASAYNYDAAGNQNGGSNTVGTGNQLQGDGTWSYSYDNAGDLTGKTDAASGVTWAYAYDNKNELTSAVETDSGGTEVSVAYSYDAFGNLLSQAVWTAASGTTVTTKFAYDGWNPAIPNPQGNEQWNAWADLNADDSLQRRYVWGDAVSQLFGRVDSSGNGYWTLTDHLGSVRQVLDGSGATVLSQVVYDAWGNATYQVGTAADAGRYQWSGQELDVETGLQYNRARWYDAGTGRWMTQDPMGFDAGDSNLYRYVGNQPTDRTDPSGEQRSHDPRALRLIPPRPDYFKTVWDETVKKADKYGDAQLGAQTQKALLEGEAFAGPEMGFMLTKLRSQVTADFNKMEYSQILKMANSLYSVSKTQKGERTAGIAWDIREMAFSDKKAAEGKSAFQSGKFGKGMFGMYVTINGNSYFAGAVNYYYWGLVNRLIFEREMAHPVRAQQLQKRFEVIRNEGVTEYYPRPDGSAYATNRAGKTIELPGITPTQVTLERALGVIGVFRTFGPREWAAGIEERRAWAQAGWTGNLGYVTAYKLNPMIAPAPASEKYQGQLTVRAGYDTKTSQFIYEATIPSK